jgi:Family of unknown function (DUF6461)
VSTDEGIWGWTGDIGQLGFTVTFSLGLAPEDVLAQYGADPGRAELLTREQAWGRYPADQGGTQLRAGTIGRWGFCFEEAGVEGMKTRTLARLSADTETIGFFTASGTSSFIFLKDGAGVEAFEPGRPETLRGEPPHLFWTATHKVLERMSRTGEVVPTHAVLQAITKHVRAALDRTALEGPLLTVFLRDVDRAPMSDDFAGRPTPPRGNPMPRPGAAGPPVQTPPASTPASWNAPRPSVDNRPGGALRVS